MRNSNLFRAVSGIVCLMVAIGMCAVAVTASGETADMGFSDGTTTTTRVTPDYVTRLDYDDSPMTVGETRAIRFYHPVTNTAAGGSVYEVSENLSFSYEEGSDTVYVTALSAGSAKLYIRESDCSFGAYAYLTVEDDEAVQGDINGDGTIDMLDAFSVYTMVSGGNEGTEDQKAAADMNGDGDLDMRDAFALYKIASGE